MGRLGKISNDSKLKIINYAVISISQETTRDMDQESLKVQPLMLIIQFKNLTEFTLKASNSHQDSLPDLVIVFKNV